MLFYADDVRDDLARLFDDHHVADADVLALDLFGIVQAGAADRGAGQLDRFQVGDRRNRAGFADLHADVIDLGRPFVLLEFIGDDPPRALGRAAEPLALLEVD